MSYATSFMDLLVSDDEEEVNTPGRDEENHILQKMHEKIKSLEDKASSVRAKLVEVEEERDKEKLISAELKEKLDKKSKDFNGLKTHLSLVENTTLS